MAQLLFSTETLRMLLSQLEDYKAQAESRGELLAELRVDLGVPEHVTETELPQAVCETLTRKCQWCSCQEE